MYCNSCIIARRLMYDFTASTEINFDLKDKMQFWEGLLF